MNKASKAKIKKVSVDPRLCLGCGMCVSLCPEIFEINDEGKSQVKNVDAPFEKIEDIIKGCPAGAIKLGFE